MNESAFECFLTLGLEDWVIHAAHLKEQEDYMSIWGSFLHSPSPSLSNVFNICALINHASLLNYMIGTVL